MLSGDCNFFLGVNDTTVVENTGFQDNKSLYIMYPSPSKIKAAAFVCIKFNWADVEPKCLLLIFADIGGNGFIHTNDLTDVLKAANLPLPGYKARELIQNLTTTGDGRISFDEFISVSKMLFISVSKMLVPRAQQRHKHRVSWAPS